MTSEIRKIVSRWPFLATAGIEIAANRMHLNALQDKLDPPMFQEMSGRLKDCQRVYQDCESNSYDLGSQLRLEIMLHGLHKELNRQAQLLWG